MQSSYIFGRLVEKEKLIDYSYADGSSTGSARLRAVHYRDVVLWDCDHASRQSGLVTALAV